MFLTDTGLIYKGIRPLQRIVLGNVLANPLSSLSLPHRVPDHLKVVPPDPGRVKRSAAAK